METIVPSYQSNFTFGQSCQVKAHHAAISSITGSLGISSWSLATKMSFFIALEKSSDELSSYLCMPLSREDVVLLQKEDGIIEFRV